MKKFFAILLAVLGLTLTGLVPAQASTVPSVAITQVSTIVPPKAVTTPFNLAGGGGIVPLANFTSCYWNIFGQYWCYRYGCTLYDLVKYNCYNGWIKINRPIYT